MDDLTDKDFIHVLDRTKISKPNGVCKYCSKSINIDSCPVEDDYFIDGYGTHENKTCALIDMSIEKGTLPKEEEGNRFVTVFTKLKDL